MHGLHPGAALSLMHRMEEAGVTTDWDAVLLLLTEAVREAVVQEVARRCCLEVADRLAEAMVEAR